MFSMPDFFFLLFQVGANPHAPLEVSISLSPRHRGGVLRWRGQDGYSQESHWKILHPPCPGHGPQSGGETGI